MTVHFLANHTPEYGAPEAYSIQFAANSATTELLRPFYRPSAERKLGERAVLHSLDQVEFVRLPGNRHEYLGSKNGILDVKDFESRQLSELQRRLLAFPLLSHVRVLGVEKSSALRIELAVGVQAEQGRLLEVMPEFRAAVNQQSMKVTHDIRASAVMENPLMLRYALDNLRSNLGVAHPAAKALALHRRQVDEKQYYATVSNKHLQYIPRRRSQ